MGAPPAGSSAARPLLPQTTRTMPRSEPDPYRLQLERLEAWARYEPRPHSRSAEKLAPLRALLERLGQPQRGGRVVHIAGTNGKGTVAEMLNRLLLARGLSTGLYTSPHLVDIRERIRIGGALISRDAFTRGTAAVLDEAMRMPEREGLSYFDLLTAIGFVAFRGAGTEWRVLETGLGGTADATNVSDKELCVLTPIGHDHAEVLGEELKAIARQKMGIVSPGTPAVLGKQPEELADWMAGELERQASRAIQGAGIAVVIADDDPEAVRLRWPGGPEVVVPLPRYLQTGPRLDGAATALTALDTLFGTPTGPAEAAARARTALETPLPGRLQVLENVALASPPKTAFKRLVLDGAHNPEALEALARHLARWKISGYTLLFAMLRDKMVDRAAEPLRSILAGAERIVGVALPFSRAPRPAELQAYLEALRPPGGAGPVPVVPPAEALAMAAGEPERPVVAAGSLWMIGELMRLLVLPPVAPEPGGAAPAPQ